MPDQIAAPACAKGLLIETLNDMGSQSSVPLLDSVRMVGYTETTFGRRPGVTPNAKWKKATDG
jgi:hypothetical protein